MVLYLAFVISAGLLVLLPVVPLALRGAIASHLAASACAQLRVPGLVALIAAIVGAGAELEHRHGVPFRFKSVG